MELSQDVLVLVLGGFALLLLLLVIWVFYLSLRLRRLGHLLNRLLPEGEQRSLEQLLEQLLIKQEENRTLLASLEDRLDQLHRLTQGCLQRVGLVRFDAFDDTAGQQSFSLALLDQQGNGIVITSLFGRTESRCYAKPVTSGGSTYPLSEEEQTAIRQALQCPLPAGGTSHGSGR